MPGYLQNLEKKYFDEKLIDLYHDNKHLNLKIDTCYHVNTRYISINYDRLKRVNK